MTKEMKKRILRELYSYPQNKDISRVIKDYLQVNKELFTTLAIINSIECALAELPHEIREYAQKKFFCKNYYTPSGLAMELNVSIRTVQRWEELLLQTIAGYFVLIDW